MRIARNVHACTDSVRRGFRSRPCPRSPFSSFVSEIAAEMAERRKKERRRLTTKGEARTVAMRLRSCAARSPGRRAWPRVLVCGTPYTQRAPPLATFGREGSLSADDEHDQHPRTYCAAQRVSHATVYQSPYATVAYPATSQNCIGSRVRIPQFDSAQKTQTGVVTGSKPTLAFTCYPPVPRPDASPHDPGMQFCGDGICNGGIRRLNTVASHPCRISDLGGLTRGGWGLLTLGGPSGAPPVLRFSFPQPCGEEASSLHPACA